MSNMRDAVGLCLPYGKAKSQYETEFEPATSTVWGYFNPKDGVPCYSVGLLKDILEHDQHLMRNGGKVEVEGALHEVNYYVTASRTPGVFNVGGDLALFSMLIKAGDRDALANYAKLCIDNIYPRTRAFFSPTLTKIVLVQGDALGGGFECALASDVIVAEESAQMGLPEILFNLFPGMGACSLLTRRIGIRAAEELILSGKIYSAAELHKMGVVDVIATDGHGESAVRNWIAKNAKRRNGLQAVHRARQFIHPVTREELDGIVGLWVDAAMRLSERDLKMMGRLVRAQVRRTEPRPAGGGSVIEMPLAQPLAAAGIHLPIAALI
ncbi:MAG TPA: crotonase/enoyl-CoA hydratase family protein [Burkholderiales bacterium]|nr:crotonase/enoyl-CoA hydratase family protein [Burkholderiales bacterium]